jgi:hypothetical protein
MSERFFLLYIAQPIATLCRLLEELLDRIRGPRPAR